MDLLDFFLLLSCSQDVISHVYSDTIVFLWATCSAVCSKARFWAENLVYWCISFQISLWNASVQIKTLILNYQMIICISHFAQLLFGFNYFSVVFEDFLNCIIYSSCIKLTLSFLFTCTSLQALLWRYNSLINIPPQNIFLHFSTYFLFPGFAPLFSRDSSKFTVPYLIERKTTLF